MDGRAGGGRGGGRDGANDLEAGWEAGRARSTNLITLGAAGGARPARPTDDATCEGRLFDGGETRSNVIPPVIK